jgi:DNA-directed RNA polymerase subunit RPC12/RpoP
MKMSGMTGTWIGMKSMPGPGEPQRYNCQRCGREIVTFSEKKNGKIKECLRCTIKLMAKKQK